MLPSYSEDEEDELGLSAVSGVVMGVLQVDEAFSVHGDIASVQSGDVEIEVLERVHCLFLIKIIIKK